MNFSQQLSKESGRIDRADRQLDTTRGLSFLLKIFYSTQIAIRYQNIPSICPGLITKVIWSYAWHPIFSLKSKAIGEIITLGPEIGQLMLRILFNLVKQFCA